LQRTEGVEGKPPLAPNPPTCLAAENKLRPIAHWPLEWVSDGRGCWAVWAELWGNQGKVPPLWLLSAFLSFFFPPVSLIQLTWRPLARHANVALPSNVTWPQGIGGQQGKCSLGHIHGQRYSAGSLLNTLTYSPGDKLGKI